MRLIASVWALCAKSQRKSSMKTYEVSLTTSTSVVVRIEAENEADMADKISDLDVMNALQEQIAQGQTYLDWVIDDWEEIV